MGLLTTEDVTLMQEWFKEMTYLRGISVKYRYPIDELEEVTIHSEIKDQFSELIDLDIIFQEVPEVKTLKRIGWVAEDPEDKPCIAMLPIDTPYLQVKSRILIPPIGQAIPGRWFEVSSIHSILEYPSCYTCTLAPIFETKPDKNDHSETNYNYIDAQRANQPDQDAPNNYPLDINFQYLRGIKNN